MVTIERLNNGIEKNEEWLWNESFEIEALRSQGEDVSERENEWIARLHKYEAAHHWKAILQELPEPLPAAVLPKQATTNRFTTKLFTKTA
jgi:hypothetical protein